MISFDQAYQMVLASMTRKALEQVALSDAMDRTLAREIAADRDVPFHDLSAMDGYACRRADQAGPLTVTEVIAAGCRPTHTVGPGQCARIMTGAMVPAGADTVIMFENAVEQNGKVTVTQKSDRTNIRYQGEDLKTGDRVLAAGTRLGPAEIAALAMVGCDPVMVSQQPVVGVIATGDELVEPTQTLSMAQIRNSNSYQLCAQVRRAGGLPRYYGIAHDSRDALAAILQTALHECDTVLLTGGVSMGDFDVVPDILRENGVDIRFEKIAVKPGKPTVFGLKGCTCVFGLPGNPVSSFVIFEMLVRPALAAMMGSTHRPVVVTAPLVAEIRRRKTERIEFVPVAFNAAGQVTACAYHGAGHIHAYTQADGVVAMPAGQEYLAAGSAVTVILIR
jgi:molybdopterin molybdotransferase